MVNGVLTGFDLAMCPCCGGVFIDIGDTTYRINSIPASSSIDLQNDSFPINVELTYTMDTAAAACMGMHIKSDDIRRR
jgi:Zn-finger nucleic acid-binding protein